MKSKFAAPFLVALGLVLVFAAGAWAEPELITVSLTSPQTSYTPGQDNTFTFDVGLVYSGAEYVDRYQFVFPAGLTIVSATPASGAGTCGGDDGIQSICGTTVTWAMTGVPCSGAFAPTGCGCYNAATSTFTVTVTVPAGFTGPMVVTLNSLGDGYNLPGGTVDTDTVTFAQGGGCTLTVSCPDNMTATAPPGATGAAVDFPLPTTGGTCTDATAACTPAPGDFFAVGTTTVACTATATGGTPADCSFDVTVGNQALQEIPAASTLGLAALALLLAGAAFVALRRLG